jgi:hypothetical protein
METKEIKEIEIFTMEQLEILPQEAKDSIINLGNNLPQKELLVLNPLVTELLKIKELEKLKYTPLAEDATKEQIAEHKANIEEFKAAKKCISALTSQNALAKKSIKGPLDLLGKQVLNIEKSVNTIAKEVLDAIELTFKDYIDAEKEKAAIALAKREAKATEAINKLTEQNTAQANIFKKSTLVTFLKYEMLGETKTEVNNAIENYALDNLFSVRDMLALKTWEHFTQGQELTLLEEQELIDLKAFFEKEMTLFKSSINVKITALQLEKDNEKLITKIETIEDAPVAVPVAPVSQNIMAGTDIFNTIANGTNQPLGTGASINTLPKELYPNDDKNVDFLDLVIDEINNCKDNIAFIRERFMTSLEVQHTDQDKENIRRVLGAGVLLDKTILYILNQLPPKTN